MIGYSLFPYLFVKNPDWEPDPRQAFVSLVYNGARPRNLKTKNSRKDKEGGLGGKLSFSDRVTLKPTEHAKLVAQYGETNTRRAIAKLSAYKVSKDKRYKSDYGAILSWAMASVLGQKNGAVPEPVRVSSGPPSHVTDRHEPTLKEIREMALIGARLNQEHRIPLTKLQKAAVNYAEGKPLSGEERKLLWLSDAGEEEKEVKV